MVKGIGKKKGNKKIIKSNSRLKIKSTKSKKIKLKQTQKKKRYLLQEMLQLSPDIRFNLNLKDPQIQKQVAREIANKWSLLPSEEKKKWFEEARFSDDLKNVLNMAAKQLLDEGSKNYNAFKFKAAAELYNAAGNTEASKEVIKKQGEIISNKLPSPIVEKEASAEEIRSSLKKRKGILGRIAEATDQKEKDYE